MKLAHGIYNIYKPPGPTSHDMVDLVRKLSGEKRVGHAGTLDPFAEGVLIIAVGREYTKQLGQFLKKDKTYIATLRLGASSDTGDITGKLTPRGSTSGERPTREEVVAVLKKFVGEIAQTPPAYSAIQVAGQRAYALARQGLTPKLAPRKITIYSLKLLSYRWPNLKIETKVSSGTYIRVLAEDIGETLKTKAYLTKLIRTSVSDFKVNSSLKL
ncbi:MAG: tRNA pseudouridine(55) synthase TruB [Candidatus Yanofskybacteria bacterium RIFCSPHIGHO2_12_FULL_45_19b]|uniref:tRNA pseudouridine synthase B n=1 Tax=Candidatus Yanofskybacteria bacterium RIFCSPHIGHO2_12_FULL_45_19b TaxID=1802689 RepID=A0A1F8G5V6_9BACT|nr:MAG: tRNA pseudouridine(55) synthase TruB [Candidatus Yanofskybacteria bacterium RIFCSPHIGHO2_12_FULL_45_19b]